MHLINNNNMIQIREQQSYERSRKHFSQSMVGFILLNVIFKLLSKLKSARSKKHKFKIYKCISFSLNIKSQKQQQRREVDASRLELGQSQLKKKKKKKKNNSNKQKQTIKQQDIQQSQQLQLLLNIKKEQEKEKEKDDSSNNDVQQYPKQSIGQRRKKKKLDPKSRKLNNQLKIRKQRFNRSLQVSNQRLEYQLSLEVRELIERQLALIYNYFLEQLQVVVPYSGLWGKYRLSIVGTFKQVKVEWDYHGCLYPREPMELKFSTENLSVVQKQRIEGIVVEGRGECVGAYILGVLTRIDEELHVMVYAEEEVVVKKQKVVESLEGVDREEIYQEILEEIFYLNDFREEPEVPVMRLNSFEESHMVQHRRGRYQQEFDELGLVGEGGFGKVYRARNKLDKNIYAVKKIAINYADPSQRKLIKEVSTLSKLNHPNIVRYYQSWLEDTADIDQLLLDMSVAPDNSQAQDYRDAFKQWDNSRPGIRFMDLKEDEDEEEDENSESIMFIAEPNTFIQEPHYAENNRIENSRIEFHHNNSEPSKQLSQITHQLQNYQDQRFPFKILYIQMQFCQGITLKQFIYSGKEKEEVKVQIVRGILQGLTYIHRKKIIHRDLKPANIFLDNNRRPKIGDFGLATPLSSLSDDSKSIHIQLYEASQMSTGVGTGFYRAPELLRTRKYDQKADMYSLGIMMVELWYPFGTNMQRHEKITQISKSHRLPKDFNRYGARKTEYQEQIESLICEDPRNRPSAAKVLENFRNKYFTHLVSCIANPKHFQFYQLLKHLFSIKNERVYLMRKDLFSDFAIGDILRVYEIHRASFFIPIPLVPVVDYQMLNSKRIPENRDHKLLLLSEKGVLFEYPQNSYNSWVRYAKETLKRRRVKEDSEEELRRYTFEKLVQFEDLRVDCKDEHSFKERFVTAFDIAYPFEGLEGRFVGEHFGEALKVGWSVVQSLELTQRDPCICMCHSRVYSVLARELKVPQERLYAALLSTSEEKLGALALPARISYFQMHGLDLNCSKRLCKLMEEEKDSAGEWLSLFEECSELLQIREEALELSKYQEYFQLPALRWRLRVPPNNCCGLFWWNGPLRGFSSIEEITNNYDMCNIHLEMNLTPQHLERDVGLWCNGEPLQEQLMTLLNKCWQAGLSTKSYHNNVGEKDETSRNNIILRKRKGRVYLTLRKANETKKQENTGQISKEILKEHFDFQSIRALKTKKSFYN